MQTPIVVDIYERDHFIQLVLDLFAVAIHIGLAVSNFTLLLFVSLQARFRVDPVSSEISDLSLFVSYFSSQSKGTKFGDLLFWCVLSKLKLFGCMSDTHNKLLYVDNYNHRQILDLVVDLNYFSFSNPNPTHLPKHQTLRQLRPTRGPHAAQSKVLCDPL